MPRFESILVYYNVDRDDATALRRAVDLAAADGAAITVMDTVPELSWYARVVEGYDASTVERARRNRRALIEGKVADIDDHGSVARIEVAVGAPAVEVIREVLRHGHDLVMKVAEGSTGLRATLFGPKAHRLLRKCPCPVWIIRPDRRENPARILVTVDPDPGDERGLALDRAAVDLASRLAARFGAELRALHVWDFGLYRMARNHVDQASYDAFFATVKDDLRAPLVSFLESVGAGDLPLRLVEGDPGTVIPEFARHHDVDLVVMGSARSGRDEGVLAGRVAEAVFDRLDCSLLVVKPDDFVSPIRVE